ncbi:MAG: thiamine-phosphate kinase [Proteobacteria bacterium]|nr:thiamine-phosphate kinase [Pseudomonadota bacterium]MDA1356801.1 thiamine-phosphate kinase [Pseudomonadota bacterium]
MSDLPQGAEFELIMRHFAPLSTAEAGAYGLRDDAASLVLAPGRELIVTKDMMAAGVHFFADDPAQTLGRKILRANLSDLAAMGATPRAYAMGLALPAELPAEWLTEFAAGLAADQAQFGVTLIGGDTIRAASSLTLSLTAFGEVPQGQALRRSGARAGDDIYVSGTIGDAALGLLAAEGGLAMLSQAEKSTLIMRYRLPQPRTELGKRLIGLAGAAIDVSDGLIADLGHICTASVLGARIEANLVPLSPAAAAACAADAKLLVRAFSGGDDYELLIAAPPAAAGELANAAKSVDVALTRIGAVHEGSGVRVMTSDGDEMNFTNTGYEHF